MLTNRKKTKIIGIDPGLGGAIVCLDDDSFQHFKMPIVERGKDKDIDFENVKELLSDLSKGDSHIFLERAVPMAMGAKHAFNYGRGFMALEIAVKLTEKPVTYVEPSRWSKIMHDGISADYKPKAKSLIAVERLMPHFFSQLPKKKNGKVDDGAIDALLIAAYGKRYLNV